MLVPKLRFPGFEDEWQVVKLGDIAHFSKGAGVSKSDIDLSGSREAIRYGELYTIYGEVVGDVHSKIIPSERDVLSEDNDVLIPSSGETAIDISTATYVGKNGVAVGGDLNIIRTNESGRFLSYLLNHGKKLDVARLAQGVSVVHLYASELKGLQIEVPAKEEQEKIADFLMAVDERIELQSHKVEKLETYKRGLTQKIFTRTLRFKRDDGSDFPEWKNKKLGEIVERINRKNDVGSKNILTISAQHGLVSQDKYFSKVVASENLNSYYLMNRGDFAYNKSYSKGYPMGAVKRLYGNEGIVSPLYICFRAKSTIVGEYLDQYFFSGLHNSEIYKIAQEGVRNHGLLNVSVVDFFSINIIIPACNEEQQKIATFLSQIDEKITLETEKLEELKKFKKALLQRMFV